MPRKFLNAAVIFVETKIRGRCLISVQQKQNRKPVILCAGPEADGIASLLKREGYDVAFVRNGLEAWRWLFSKSFDLLIAPIGLAGLDGIRLAERIRLLWIPTPLLFLSRIGDPFSRVQRARLGIAGILKCDCASHVLLAAVRATLDTAGKFPSLSPSLAN
jgi:DNA-binding response OmpR family regulator